MDYGGKDICLYLNGRLGLLADAWQERSQSCACRLGLLQSRLNGCPLCVDNTAEGSMHKCVSI